MLIKCPECNNQISDKATMCIHCGCPRDAFNITICGSVPIQQKPVKKANAKRKHMRLPNGYGYIQHLSGKRRYPYIAYAPLSKSDYDDNGKPTKREKLGKFKTYNNALECLVNYHNSHGYSTDGCPTFAQIWEKILEREQERYPDKFKGLGKSRYYSYTSAFKKCQSLHNVPIKKIYANEMQDIIDKNSNEFGYSTLTNISIVYNMIFEYAFINNYVDKNYASYVSVGKTNDAENGEPFTEEQVKILWQNSEKVDAQITLILIYSGLRISELKEAKINLEDRIFQGGLKTPSGKNRIVPIHDAIFEFVKNFNQKKYVPERWRKNFFYPLMNDLGIELSAAGTKHTPHDCRHTFSHLADKGKMDKISKHLIMGHKLSKDVEDNVYGHRTKEELESEMKKIEVIRS